MAISLELKKILNSAKVIDFLRRKAGTTPALSNELLGDTVDDSFEKFSTTEINTGNKWIDGKTIFRKVFTVPAQPNNNQVFLPIGATVEAWVGRGGFINDGANILMLPVPIPNSTNSIVGIAITTSGTILQIHAGNDAAHDGGFVWIEYTKT